jgi:hypothetical protein
LWDFVVTLGPVLVGKLINAEAVPSNIRELKCRWFQDLSKNYFKDKT